MYACNCDGGGGGGSPPPPVTFALLGYGNPVTTHLLILNLTLYEAWACVGSPAGVCPTNYSATLTEPLIGAANEPYTTVFGDGFPASGGFNFGGSGASYYWGLPGSSSWVLGGAWESYNFTSLGVGTYSVETEVVVPGDTPTTLTMTVDVVVGSPPSGSTSSFSIGVLGWGLSLNEQATGWAIKSLSYGAAAAFVAAPLAALAGGVPGAVALLLSGILSVYDAWATAADAGNGVCFFDAGYVTLPLVTGNPCPPGF
jgi:hypothetical protein